MLERLLRTHPGRRWLSAGLLAAAMLPGCYGLEGGHHDPCATIAPGAIPPPAGTHLHEINSVQAANAEADDFVIYNMEWAFDRPGLGPYGQYHINMIARRLPTVPFFVLIQQTPDDALNQTRRATVVAYLNQRGIENADARVLIGFPAAEGLSGDEANRIYVQGFERRGGGYGGYGGGYGGYDGSGPIGVTGPWSGNGGRGGFGGIGGFGGYGGGFGGIGGYGGGFGGMLR
jgi:hypothetical protein